MLLTPFLIPLFLYALVIVSMRSQFQALMVVLVAPHVFDVQTFLLVVVFTSVSVLLGRMRSAADAL